MYNKFAIVSASHRILKEEIGAKKENPYVWPIFSCFCICFACFSTFWIPRASNQAKKGDDRSVSQVLQFADLEDSGQFLFQNPGIGFFAPWTKFGLFLV